ncbi:MAG: L,D-transpeptidase family protein [Candidatus Omnitrophota bacterium]
MNKRYLIIGLGLLVIILGVALSRGPARKTNPVDSGALPAQQSYELAVSLEGKNELLNAKELYQKIISESPDFKDIGTVQKKLEDLNMRIIFSGLETPQTLMHEVVSGDSLGKIANKYNTTVALIKKSNKLSSDTIRVGQRLRIWQGVFNIFVDKSQNILILKSGDEILKVYTVSTGSDNITPVGTFTVVNKLVDPVWYKSGAIIPPESPKNILGTRWLGFDIPGYGIHGTTEPQSLGQQVTAGCIRMSNEEVEELYDLAPKGTKVTIVD